MKVFILNPPFVKDFVRSARWAAKSRGRVQRHPDGLLILAAHLKRKGHTIYFIDGPVQDSDKKSILNKIMAFHPDMMVFHTTTPSIYNDLEYAQLVKQILPDCITVALGAHVSALPEETMTLAKRDYENSVDAIAVGEYDYSIAELAASPSNIDKIAGLATSKNVNKKFQLRCPGDINELPFPAWEFIRPEDYRDAGKRFPFLTLINARGCIGNCSFCRDRESNTQNILRQRDTELVVAEIKHDIRLFPQIQEIMFETDNFPANAEYTEELCQKIIRAGINKQISWSCNSRVDINLDSLKIMREAGCRMLMVGFEFGTQLALDAVNKGTTLAQAKEFAATADKLGFTIHGCFMIGAPGETEESAQKTIDFAKSLPCDTVQFSGLCPYPGTALYEWAKNNNFLVPRDWKEWVDNNYEQCTLLSYPQLPKEKIDQLIDKGLNQFYLRPRQILQMLLKIRSFADIRRKFYGFKSFLKYFSKR
ncbi:MAG: hypothetical protein ACD_39C00875G0004 [uncultured bacterium]|nr:MAG: hypothetical protein ACD_39C00875G0004 [uncultured bacterium]